MGKIPYLELLNKAGLQFIEENAEIVLEEIGIEFKDDPDALERFKEYLYIFTMSTTIRKAQSERLHR